MTVSGDNLALHHECFYDNNTSVLDSVILVAHNAHVNPEDGNYRFHYQQNYGLTDLLEHQVYGLMWDLYPYKGEVYLCHGSCSDFKVQLLQRAHGQIMGHQTLEQNLRKCNDFIQQNPQTIVFLFLESYVTAPEIETVLKKTGVLDKTYNATLDQNVTFGFLRKNQLNFVIYSDYAQDRKNGNLTLISQIRPTTELRENYWELENNKNCTIRNDFRAPMNSQFPLLINYFATISNNRVNDIDEIMNFTI